MASATPAVKISDTNWVIPPEQQQKITRLKEGEKFTLELVNDSDQRCQYDLTLKQDQFLLSFHDRASANPSAPTLQQVGDTIASVQQKQKPQSFQLNINQPPQDIAASLLAKPEKVAANNLIEMTRQLLHLKAHWPIIAQLKVVDICELLVEQGGHQGVAIVKLSNSIADSMVEEQERLDGEDLDDLDDLEDIKDENIITNASELQLKNYTAEILREALTAAKLQYKAETKKQVKSDLKLQALTHLPHQVNDDLPEPLVGLVTHALSSANSDDIRKTKDDFIYKCYEFAQQAKPRLSTIQQTALREAFADIVAHEILVITLEGGDSNPRPNCEAVSAEQVILETILAYQAINQGQLRALLSTLSPLVTYPINLFISTHLAPVQGQPITNEFRDTDTMRDKIFSQIFGVYPKSIIAEQQQIDILTLTANQLHSQALYIESAPNIASDDKNLAKQVIESEVQKIQGAKLQKVEFLRVASQQRDGVDIDGYYRHVTHKIIDAMEAYLRA